MEVTVDIVGGETREVTLERTGPGTTDERADAPSRAADSPAAGPGEETSVADGRAGEPPAGDAPDGEPPAGDGPAGEPSGADTHIGAPTYDDLCRAAGYNPHEVSVLVDGRPVPGDRPVAAERVELLRLVRGG